MCQVEKPESEFPKHGRDGKYLKHHCKECHKIYCKSLPSSNKEARKQRHKAYYEKNREEIMSRTSAYGKANRDQTRKTSQRFRKKRYLEFLEFKKTLSCVRCGNTDYRCLEFHHLDRSSVHDRISNLYHSKNLFEQELKKCIVLCANCHSIEHFEERELASFD